MKLDKDKFYVLDGGNQGKWIFTSRSEAITQMKSVVKTGSNDDNTKLLSIDCTNDKWAIIQVPWQEIAFELIKEQG